MESCESWCIERGGQRSSNVANSSSLPVTAHFEPRTPPRKEVYKTGGRRYAGRLSQ
jgi:hypothetical protein